MGIPKVFFCLLVCVVAVYGNFTPESWVDRSGLIAIELVFPGMKVGVGEGPAVESFINALAKKISVGLLSDVTLIPTSMAIEALATELGIPVGTLDEHPVLDLSIDTADEFDASLNVIKGRNGNVVRKRLVDSVAKVRVALSEDTKSVEALGVGPIPIEAIHYAPVYTENFIVSFFGEIPGCTLIRRQSNGADFVTDDAHIIIDMQLNDVLFDYNSAALALLGSPSIVDVGLFTDMTEIIVVAEENGVYVLQKEVTAEGTPAIFKKRIMTT